MARRPLRMRLPGAELCSSWATGDLGRAPIEASTDSKRAGTPMPRLQPGRMPTAAPSAPPCCRELEAASPCATASSHCEALAANWLCSHPVYNFS